MATIRKARTQKEQELIGVLREKMLDEPEYINGVLLLLETDDERQAMIDEIEAGNVATSDDALLFGLEIDEDRGKTE